MESKPLRFKASLVYTVRSTQQSMHTHKNIDSVEIPYLSFKADEVIFSAFKKNLIITVLLVALLSSFNELLFLQCFIEVEYQFPRLHWGFLPIFSSFLKNLFCLLVSSFSLFQMYDGYFIHLLHCHPISGTNLYASLLLFLYNRLP